MTVLLEIEHVSKSFERGLRMLDVLRDVSLTVHARDFVGIYGKPSSGKSTLLRIAAGLIPPDAGKVKLSGRDLKQLSPAELAAVYNCELAWVERTGPQSREWRMADWVALPLMYRKPREARRLALDALKRVDALDCATARWEDLGNKERLLVAVAHAIAREPALLVLDDPTSGLDAVESDRVLSLLRGLADTIGFGVLMAVPDMSSMLRANEVFSLSRGRLLGPPDPPDDEDEGQVVDFPGGAKRSA